MYWYLFEGFIPYFYCYMRSCAPVVRLVIGIESMVMRPKALFKILLFNVKASFHESTLLIINVKKYLTILLENNNNSS